MPLYTRLILKNIFSIPKRLKKRLSLKLGYLILAVVKMAARNYILDSEVITQDQ